MTAQVFDFATGRLLSEETPIEQQQKVFTSEEVTAVLGEMFDHLIREGYDFANGVVIMPSDDERPPVTVTLSECTDIDRIMKLVRGAYVNLAKNKAGDDYPDVS